MPAPTDFAALERTLREQLAARHDPSAPYDYLVTYSGGKDSSYLAHWLKQAPGGRVCLFSIDNGFHSDYERSRRIRNAALLDCDFYVYHGRPDSFARLYRFILENSAALRQLAAQPLCALCQAYMVGLAIEFAAQHRIPVVAHGFTMEQFTYGQEVNRTPTDIAALMMFNRLYLQRVRKAIATLPAYQQDATVRSMVDTLTARPPTVEVVYPFMYLEHEVEAVKRELEQRYGWQNTLPGVSNADYVISSCELGDLRGVLTRYLGHRDQIRELLEADHARGRITDQAYERTRELLATEAGPEVTPRLAALLDRLGVRELFR